MPYNYLFPTCVWADEQFTMSQEILPIAREYLDKYGETFSSNSNHVSTYRNRSTSQKITNDIRLKPLIDYLLEQSKDYIKKQNVNLDIFKPKIENFDNFLIFFNKIGKTAAHPTHAHPNSILSGCFYLNCNEKDSPLILTDPRSYHNYVFYDQKIYDETNINTLYADFAIPVKTGLIMLWPAWLQHMVPEQQVDSERITVVFNIGAW